MQVGAAKEDFEKMQLDWRDVSTRYFASVQPNGTRRAEHTLIAQDGLSSPL